MELFRKIRTETLLIVVLCMAAFFVNNSALSTDGEEAKIVVTARDIANMGNWTSPSMNGVECLSTPPLAAWVAAFVERMYPDNISAQRCVSAVLATICCLFFLGVARYMERRRGFAELATMVFLTCYHVIYMGRMVSHEVYSITFTMGAIYFLMRLFYDSRYYAHPHKWRWALLAGLMMGLSFLSNGIMTFYALFLPFAITTMMLKRPELKGRGWPLLLTTLVAFLSFGWWYAWLFTHHPEATGEVLKSELAPWITGHARPWYYYWRFFAEVGVWAVLALASFFVFYWRKRVSTKRPYLMSMLWVVVALVLLSIMPEKSMDDLVVLMPPLAMAVACLIYYYIEQRPTDTWGKVLFFLNGFIIALFIFALPFLIHVFMTNQHIIDFGTAFCVNVLFIGIGIYVAVSTTRKEMKSVVKGVLALFIISECLLFSSIDELVTNSNHRSIGLVNTDKLLKEMPIYHNVDETLRMELVYEAKRHIQALDLNDKEAVMKALPCMLVTQKSLNDELPKYIIDEVDTMRVGVFDDNRLPQRNSHYRKELVNHVSVIRAKAKVMGHDDVDTVPSTSQ
ncbi:MAG: glycosyltransferase family 39 protein [Prevotella sp.]|nr:glycosyltransferase family 39 protein [Prevotella sp.]